MRHKHWRQRRRGCRGHIPPNILVGGDVNGNIPPQYYYVLLDIADQYWLPSVRSASSRFHSAKRRHQFASVRQADSRLTRLVPANLELALTPLDINYCHSKHILTLCKTDKIQVRWLQLCITKSLFHQTQYAVSVMFCCFSWQKP